MRMDSIEINFGYFLVGMSLGFGTAYIAYFLIVGMHLAINIFLERGR